MSSAAGIGGNDGIVGSHSKQICTCEVAFEPFLTPLLALFLLPALLLVPVKLAALYLIRDGRVTLGVAIIVTAKLVGTAFVGRLFILVETQLMEFAWFARCVAWWRVTRGRVTAALRRSVLWHNGRALRSAWRNWRRRVAAEAPGGP